MAFAFHARFMIARIGIGVMCKHFVVFDLHYSVLLSREDRVVQIKGKVQ